MPHRTAIQECYEKFDVLNKEDFYDWISKNRDHLIKKEKGQIVESHRDGQIENGPLSLKAMNSYYENKYNKHKHS